LKIFQNGGTIQDGIIGEKIKMAAKNQDGVRWIIFSTENAT
jgi:hypothetical protein